MKTDKLTYSFLRLREKLHRSALGFLKNDEDASDALQDTFVNLWNNGEVESESEARNKLFAVLRNVCIDRLRKSRTLPLERPEVENMISVQPQFEDMERLESLLSSGLTPIQQKIYIFVVRDGLEYEEIASRLNMTVEAVRMNMSRARKRIRENYKKLDI